MDTRLNAVVEWVRRQPGFEQARLTPVAGDASFRRYFRVESPEGSAIVMDAPPDHEDCRPFVAIARHWQSHGVAVPALIHEDLDQGFLMLEDFGDELLLTRLDDRNADKLYQGAMAELCRIQQVPDAPDYPLPPYDAALLDREMALFPDWLITRQLGITLTIQDQAMLDTAFAFLRESALAQPEVTVHRDYHSRNLLVRPGTNVPGVLDFQDAVRGPVTYDLASLLKDCYICWPEAKLGPWIEHYRNLSRTAGLHNAESDTFRQWFELMGMQRHLKAAGIFARLAIRDGKTRYLHDVPRTVGYLVEASGRQPALRYLHGWLQEVVVPALDPAWGKATAPGGQ
ncbi:aminoglycoside phosphotransferase family protein [Marinobacter salicampi]|uniref:aminoglycoside phosphotransferase family protein n=1 Tax=Marinobacter salicampi TaxID=435907 RepID=UPI0014091269|nr:phosphotransferase [Marinobacter salicampi]